MLIELEPDFPNGANLSHVGEYLLQTRLDPQKMPPNLTHCNEQCDQMWRNFPTFAKKKSLPIFCGLFSIWPNFEPTLVHFIRQIFTGCKWPNMEQLVEPMGHTDHGPH